MDSATRDDLQCFIAITAGSEQMEKMAPGSSQVAAMYFFGRIDGRDPNLDLEAAIRQVAPTMGSADVARAAVRCGKMLTARGHTMQAVGQHLMLDPQAKQKSSHPPRGS
jgi:hypothetical protein